MTDLLPYTSLENGQEILQTYSITKLQQLLGANKTKTCEFNVTEIKTIRWEAWAGESSVDARSLNYIANCSFLCAFRPRKN